MGGGGRSKQLLSRMFQEVHKESFGIAKKGRQFWARIAGKGMEA